MYAKLVVSRYQLVKLFSGLGYILVTNLISRKEKSETR